MRGKLGRRSRHAGIVVAAETSCPTKWHDLGSCLLQCEFSTCAVLKKKVISRIAFWKASTTSQSMLAREGSQPSPWLRRSVLGTVFASRKFFVHLGELVFALPYEKIHFGKLVFGISFFSYSEGALFFAIPLFF